MMSEAMTVVCFSVFDSWSQLSAELSHICLIWGNWQMFMEYSGLCGKKSETLHNVGRKTSLKNLPIAFYNSVV